MSGGESDRKRETLAELEAAYSEWGGALTRFAMRLCGSREDAEDVVVETFAEAYRQWGSFRGTGSRQSWLYGIAANRARMQRRRQRIDFERLDEDAPEPGRENRATDLIALRQEIAKLPPARREAFLLVKGGGLTAREAAQVLDRPLGTVLYDVHRATHALRRALVPERPTAPRPCSTEP